VPEDPYAANLLFTGDSLDALRILCEVPEYRSIYRGKVKLVYIDPPFPGQLGCYGLGCGCASARGSTSMWRLGRSLPERVSTGSGGLGEAAVRAREVALGLQPGSAVPAPSRWRGGR
jgi:hypothetical protein